MLTFPITTSRFHSRVLSLLSTLFSDASTGEKERSSTGRPSVVVNPLEPADTHLTPDDSISSIVGLTSSWIDLSSPDPIIADVSRQVLSLELAYAAFCGVSYIIVYGPRNNNSADVAAYARAILDGLNQGPYMQLYIWTKTHPETNDPHETVGDLASFARREFVTSHESNEGSKNDFRTWQDWDIVRSVCRYSTRLNLGTKSSHYFSHTNKMGSAVDTTESTSNLCIISLVLGACENTHPGWQYVSKKLEGVSCTALRASRLCSEAYKTEDATLVPSL